MKCHLSEITELKHTILIKMIILEENFKWHLEAFASELFVSAALNKNWLHTIVSWFRKVTLGHRKTHIICLQDVTWFYACINCNGIITLCDLS